MYIQYVGKALLSFSSSSPREKVSCHYSAKHSHDFLSCRDISAPVQCNVAPKQDAEDAALNHNNNMNVKKIYFVVL